MIKIIIILFLLNLFGKLFCDLIRFKPDLFGGDWMLAKGKYSYEKRGVLRKGILSFISDGWHFFDSIRNISFHFAIFLLLALHWNNIPVWFVIVIYAVYGLLFNITYKIWK